ncbi:uncharacterized protein LOC106051260 [Biomphalaria glabrata]|uniref:Uncharacterized protein LOC106051260 n=1 Tax=Biomphalaria glabrata TaxID=6526 RepID=A0A9U8DUP4_BIOGL|nr:uncharacterized protein LOC106051260 [Biomphalaria glabrata]
MARFLSFFAKNKILEDKLNKREDKLRQDHKYVMFRHSEVTSRLVKDLVHIHIKTPGLPISDSASENQVRSQSTELPSVQTFQTARRSQTIGMKPLNYFPYRDVTHVSNLCDGKLRDHVTPLVAIRDNKVFYKYKCLQWKKLSPNKKTHILLHKNNSVERILHRVHKMDSSGLNREQQESASRNQDTALLGKENRVNEHRRCFSITDDKEFDAEVVRLPAIEGNAIRSFCLWRRESQPPEWIYRKSNGPDRFYTPGRSMTTMN